MRGNLSNQRSAGLAVVIVAAAVAVVGCGGGSKTGSQGQAASEGQKSSSEGYTGGHVKHPDKLTIAYRSGFVNLDFQANSTQSTITYVAPLYDRLVARGKNLEIVPYLAKSWKATSTSVTFRLNNKAKCPDGTPVDANVILKSFRRLITVKKQNSFLPTMFGPGPYHISADPKANTFTFKTETPYAGLLSGFTQPPSGIICPEGLAHQDELKTKAFGSGPYELVSADPTTGAEYKLRGGYDWGPPTYSVENLPERLSYKFVQNPTTIANLVQSGGVDIGQASGTDIARLSADKSLIHVSAQNYYSYPLTMNFKPGHETAKPAIRAALMRAFSPEQFAKVAFLGNAVVSPSLNPPGAVCYTKDVASFAPKLDLAAAKKLLTDAGYEPGPGGTRTTPDGKPVQLSLVMPEDLGSGGEYLQSAFRQLGLDIKLSQLDQTQYAVAIVGGKFDITVSEYSIPLPEGTGQALAFFSGKPRDKGGQNSAWVGGGDPELDKLAKAATGSTGSAQCDAWLKIGKLYLTKNYLYPIAAPIAQHYSRGWDFVAHGNDYEVFSYAKRASAAAG